MAEDIARCAMKQVLYIAIMEIEGQPTAMGELGTQRIGKSWYAWMTVGGKRMAQKEASSREAAERECEQLRAWADAEFAVTENLETCRFRKVVGDSVRL